MLYNRSCLCYIMCLVYVQVYVNSRHLLDYRHRLTVDLISYLRLEGDASYSNIECPMHLVSCMPFSVI